MNQRGAKITIRTQSSGPASDLAGKGVIEAACAHFSTTDRRRVKGGMPLLLIRFHRDDLMALDYDPLLPYKPRVGMKMQSRKD